LSAYTLLQLLEVLLFGFLLLGGLLSREPSLAVLGGGLLMGKAILNILGLESGGPSLLRRSLIGYGLALVFVAVGITAVKLGH